MVWGGSDTDLLQLLSDCPPADARSREDLRAEDIEQDALEATALIHLGRVSEADAKLAHADRLCQSLPLIGECGSVLRAHGLMQLGRGEFEVARGTYSYALGVARQHRDKMLEGTLLLNLASVLSLQEDHDGALDLYRSSYRVANEIGANDLAQAAWSGEGWEFYNLGNPEKALSQLTEAAADAAKLGDRDSAAETFILAAAAQTGTGQFAAAEESDLHAIALSKKFSRKDKIVNASEDLSQVYIEEGRPNDADRYAAEALTLAQQAGNKPDILYCHMLQGEAAALRHDFPRADALLHEVILAPESQNRMRWNSQHTLARMYEEQGQPVAAEQAYKAAIALVEGARRDLHQELSQLTFLTNAARIYDDYIHFLVAQGRTDEALEAADWSRARTLQQGLGLIPANADAGVKPPPLRAVEIARRTRSTMLFYWMGERQSYLWAVSPEMTTLLPLPPKAELAAKMQRYRRTLLALKDPLRESGGQGDQDARELYQTLIAPVAAVIAPGRPVVLFTDGEMTQLNFETLLVPAGNSRAVAPNVGAPHYWIEDATISSAPSIRLFAARKPVSGNPAAHPRTASPAHERLLLLGDSPSADPSFPALPLAGLELQKVSERFHAGDAAVFSGAKATPAEYLMSRPEQFAYIHFVAHATASGTDPLESAVILSRDIQAAPADGLGEGSYKLYARQILEHPITARLVTISACNSGGAKSYSGEGAVGLSWAFLRAGAHNTIAALWDVSDASTPELMERLYAGLGQGEPPAAALRNAKLSLLHGGGNFARPFYWAPFQIYSGR